MLLEVSTSTGMTRSASASGGPRMTGRNKNRIKSPRTRARSVTRVTRCTLDSGTSGRRYESDATPATPAASSTASHQESGVAKYIELFLLCGQRPEIAVDLLLILGRRLVVSASGEPVLRLPFLDAVRKHRLGILKRDRRLL